MTARRSVDIAMLANEIATLDADMYVVIDALRATTMIATLFDCGVTSVTVVDSELDARSIAKRDGALLAGEVGGVAPQGFDLGNSPVEAGAAQLVGREVVLYTTNGTRALCVAAQRGPTLAGALTNAAAVVRRCRGANRVAFVCAGNGKGTSFSIEDFAVAGTIAAALADAEPGRERGDAVLLATAALGEGDESCEELMRGGRHAARLRSLGLDADIAFACQRDVTDVVPEVVAFGDGWARLEAQR